MIRRLLDWLLGRTEPELDLHEKERRLRVLAQRLEVIQRGKR